jgi:hypothetical protein
VVADANPAQAVLIAKQQTEIAILAFLNSTVMSNPFSPIRLERNLMRGPQLRAR